MGASAVQSTEAASSSSLASRPLDLRGGQLHALVVLLHGLHQATQVAELARVTHLQRDPIAGAAAQLRSGVE
jgi:hypothetical protein